MKRRTDVCSAAFLVVAGLFMLLTATNFCGDAKAAERVIDLTYAFDETTQVWPSNRPFHRDSTVQGGSAGEAWYATGQVLLSEHAGTHMDAPVHFAQGQAGIDGIAVERLMGPAVVIDVRAAVSGDRDYRLSLDDISRWEAKRGTIPAGAIVMMLTGWGAYWKDRNQYFGSATPDLAATLHFPGFSKEAAEFLVAERHIHGVGIDTPSIDYGRSQDLWSTESSGKPVCMVWKTWHDSMKSLRPAPGF
ncbi:MAG: putative Cyclase [Nitrospira sp.]|nr:putative Cyclase [Nitrospira sp.]